jgi:cell division protein FtsW (lipid II flippase)
MALTYTAAADRDASRRRARAGRPGASELLLLATSAVAAVALGLAYVGRLSALDLADSARNGPAAVNLSTVTDPKLLEPALAAVFPNADDRSLAARELVRYLTADREKRAALPNVGAIAHASVTVETIQQTPRLDAFPRRLLAARDAASLAGRVPPTTLTVLTLAELATLKPFFVVRTRALFRNEFLIYALVYLLAFHVVAAVWRWRRVESDVVLLATAHLLTAIGFAILLSRPDPLRDTPLFVRYVEGATCGLGLLAALSFVEFGTAAFLELSYLPLFGALLLSVLLIVFGYGPGHSTAKVNLGPVQPIEAIRLLLALFLAGYFARRWELLRGLRGRSLPQLPLPAWVNLPRAEYVLPVIVGVAMALLFFVVQKDLGPALLLCCVFLAIYAVARGRAGMAIGGLALLSAGFWLGYQLRISQTLVERVRMWQSPWDNSAAGGDQVAHAIWAMAAGGPFGTGLGLGETRFLPAGHTDLILAAVGEELGLIGILVVAAAYIILAWRGFRIARLAPNAYGFFLGTALTLFLIIPALIMAAGVVGVTPLTGVVTPFLSYGGSAMAANFAALGLLASIRADRRPPGDFSPFRVPTGWLGATLATALVALLAVAADVQVVRADSYASRPQLGVQADGGRRYEYNPRLLDVAQVIPRGTLYDRRGLVLATDDPLAVAASRQEYQKIGISVAEACPDASERCYPLGGRAFHVLGDVRTRANWGAPNTSYAERDLEDQLRGFDDRAQVVQTTDASGRTMSTMRRDYRDLVPMMRHRYEPTHPSVLALRRRTREVRLTIDAGLQYRVASIVASYAKKSGGKAAAVVIDPDSGAVLASASYPWPVPEASHGNEDAGGHDVNAFLDRARYGLYPPGSTFKLVTAAAALREDASLGRTEFTCMRLPDGRVGTKIKGWDRPIRDDVMDTQAHGTIDMHEGLVHSCNAYFAQLAMKLGPQALVDTAAQLGIALTPSRDVMAHVRDTLPQAGYGQGEVVATPLRMARVAAAIAADGTLRDVQWQQQRTAATAKPEKFLPPSMAHLLGGYMRDVVTNGTARTLRAHPWRIAGKTGTAEVAGSPSHSWFVGFAPYGAATRRIAFAIIVENAGYGGGAAAPAAGEIVSAAALSGLIK